MRLENMRGAQIRQAINDRIPVVIPAGTIEYHGEHLGVGCDTLVVVKTLELLEKEIPMVIAPPFAYGPSSYGVAGPEMGTIDVDNEHFEMHVRDVLWGFLQVGFRRIIVVIHHQNEGGAELPLTLAFKKAGAELIFRYLEQTRGRGWWGDEKNKSFYESLDSGDNPWNWIKVIPLMHPDVQRQTGYDHAGEHESSLLWALCPEAVDMDKRKDNKTWYTKSAEKATVEYGRKMVDLILRQLRREIE
jgi:creatinine amidohydrolase